MGKRRSGCRERRGFQYNRRRFCGGNGGPWDVLEKIRNLYGGYGRRCGRHNGFGWFTPVRSCICGAILCTLIFSGVGIYGIIIIGLLLVILQLFC